MHFSWQRLLIWLCLLAVVLLTTSGLSATPAAQAQDVEPAAAQPEQTDSSLYLPLVNNDAMNLADRLGFGSTTFPINRYPEIRNLHAGWYLNWWVAQKPIRPGGIEYAQVVFVHQKLSCGERHHGDRAACPYAQPLDYEMLPAQSQLEAIVRANPGALWFIGNEMDRRDWSYCAEFEADGRTCKPGQIKHSGQGEMLPETYARAYHDIYTMIKAADPTARIGIGGVIQATPLRLQWLDIAWQTYQNLYGQEMPVDVWNVHNFVLREERGNYGADIPPGLPNDPQTGAYIDNDCTHTDLSVFDQQIRAFRQWMKDHGQQNKELVVTEYGVLYSHQVQQPACSRNYDDAALVHNFMLGSFDYFLDTKDCALGYAADECRLVQRWLWFSLDHGLRDSNGNPLNTSANYYSSLIEVNSLQLTEAGRLFGQYARDNMNALQYK
jgi:hypothetical protein